VSALKDAEEDSLPPKHEISHPKCLKMDLTEQNKKTEKRKPGKEMQLQFWIFCDFAKRC
jgi:hypothetical protein